MDDKNNYYITVWQWNGQEYEPQTIYETDSIDKARRKYNAIKANNDKPLIELYEVGEDDDKRLGYKEA